MIFVKLGGENFPKTSKNRVVEGLVDVLGWFLGQLGSILDVFGGVLGVSGSFGRALNRIRRVSEGFWGVLEASWDGLGGSHPLF